MEFRRLSTSNGQQQQQQQNVGVLNMKKKLWTGIEAVLLLQWLGFLLKRKKLSCEEEKISPKSVWKKSRDKWK